MPDEILDIAGGNTRLADQIRELLRTHQHHENVKIREMALDTFWHTYQQMTPEQQAELEKTGREYVSRPDVR